MVEGIETEIHIIKHLKNLCAPSVPYTLSWGPEIVYRPISAGSLHGKNSKRVVMSWVQESRDHGLLFLRLKSLRTTNHVSAGCRSQKRNSEQCAVNLLRAFTGCLEGLTGTSRAFRPGSTLCCCTYM